MPRTKRTLAAGASALAFIALSPPAAAQYGPSPTATTTPTTQGSVEEAVGNVVPEQTSAGANVQVTTDPSLPPGATASVTLVRARQGATGAALGTATVGPDGAVSFAFTVPDVEPGIYLVVIEAGGEQVVAVVVVTENGTTAVPLAGSTASAGGGGSAPAALTPPVGATAVEVPAEVRALQQPADVEAELLDAARDGATVELDGSRLVAVAGPAAPAETGGSSSSAPIVVAASAAGLAALGLATRQLRRRPAR